MNKIEKYIAESATMIMTKDSDPMNRLIAKLLEQNGCNFANLLGVRDLYDRMAFCRALVKAMLQVRKDTDLRTEDPDADAMAGTNIFDVLYEHTEDSFGHPQFVEHEFLDAMDNLLEVVSIPFDSACIATNRATGLGWSSELMADGTWMPRRTMSEHLASSARYAEQQQAEKLARVRELERTFLRPKTQKELSAEMDEIEKSRPRA